MARARTAPYDCKVPGLPAFEPDFRVFSGYLSALVVLLAAGCASVGKQQDDGLKQLRQEIVRLQNRTDRTEERLALLEAQLHPPTMDENDVARRPPDEAAAQPELEIVRLLPEEQVEAVAYESDADRALLPGNGPQARARSVAREVRPKGEAPLKKAPAASEYEAALKMVRIKKYDEAMLLLSQFEKSHPQHPYADNAVYWQGECYYAKGDWQAAIDRFKRVIERYPAGNKVPDALLKLGMSEERLGNSKRARSVYARLVETYPRSEASSKIPAGSTP